ncbi:hypothetical protein CEUSTIGMA_g6063.t1 [Chlamydomonas eustigma]|uniref:Uncharacterized protein n=1 Tax=Chlamydomonas eustigma TaxID=1157962 RepID=A0A250X6B0_9CHLO|nr:hypothetical protein CEUSTIGMA_g6063.t1 [Chlamydomonas eustigma]|eukprot:GAX78624.1 hypothetical protein CEUSTIGMA_g6063.t1 [Chlamydomonas eustigma]
MHADSTIATGTAVAAAGPVSEGSSGASWVDENENAVVMIKIMGAMFSVACGVCTECALAVPAVDAAMNNGFAFPALIVFLNMMSNTAAILSVGVTVRQHRTQGTSLDTGVVIMGSYFMFATLVSSIVMGVNGFKKDITTTKYVNIPSLLMSIIGFGCTTAAYHIDRPNFSMEDNLQAWRIDVSEYVFDFLAGFVSSFNIPDAEAELQVAQLAIYAALEMTYLGLDFTSIWK